MDIIKELVIILAILFSGELINKTFGLILPGNVIGMLILFLLLLTGLVKLQQLERVSDFLLNNLTIFFIPAGVGILKYYPLLAGKIVPFLIVVVLSTLIVMIFTGYVIEISQRMVKNGHSDK